MVVLRRFAVKDGKPSLPKDADLVSAEPSEHFPLVLDSSDAKALFKQLSPEKLRTRFACFVNDNKSGQHGLLYVISPDEEGHKSLRAVPAKLLHYFFDDIEGYDWPSFNAGDVPPKHPTTGYPYFDPRFPAMALKTRTAADCEALIRKFDNPLTALLNNEPPPLKVVSQPTMEEAAPKPKSAPKPTPVEPEEADAWKFENADSSTTHEFRQSDTFRLMEIWSGEPDASAAPQQGIAAISVRTGKVPGVGESAILCERGDVIRAHRGKS